MAVYTQLSESDIRSLLSLYDIGRLESFKGIAEGVSNTNYLLLTKRESQNTNYILTLFEDNFNSADLPFFMRLTEYLAENGIVCPCPVKNKIGEVVGSIKNRPAVLIEFLQGRGNPHITPEHLRLVGELVAKLHLATSGFKQKRENALSLAGLKNMFAGFSGRADEIQAGLRKELESEFSFLTQNLPKDLPAGIVHTDIFPDNVFFIDGNTDRPELSGIIDFYFSCYDFYVYDLMIVVNAWCFNSAHEFIPERAQALFKGYNSLRKITDAEKEAMHILGRRASMRFLMTRARDWLSDNEGALVNKKDPMEYVKKLHFWQKDNKIAGLLND